RLRTWGEHYGVMFETRVDGEVIAHIGRQPAPWYELWGWFWIGYINEHGTDESEKPGRKPGEDRIVRWTFRGITERYELVPPGPGEIGVRARLLPAGARPASRPAPSSARGASSQPNRSRVTAETPEPEPQPPRTFSGDLQGVPTSAAVLGAGNRT